MARVSIIGGGAYGSALASHLSRNGAEVILWVREESVADEINHRHQNVTFLPDIPLAEGLKATARLTEAVTGREILVSVVPSQFIRPVLSEIASLLTPPGRAPTGQAPTGQAPSQLIVSASKGIEAESGKLLSQVFEETVPKGFHPGLAYLSGPSFAKELALGHPSAVALGCRQESAAVRIQQAFQSDSFFLDWTPDVTGVVLGGAVKNVIAIACGIADGLGYGHSTRAMFMTRGLHEMVALGEGLGAEPQTFHGLSGVGDLIVTCMGELSRNKRVGIEIASGKSLQKIQSEMKSVAEGVETSRAIYKLARSRGIKLPICEAVFKILHEGASVKSILG